MNEMEIKKRKPIGREGVGEKERETERESFFSFEE
jgi:hypothetical protein